MPLGPYRAPLSPALQQDEAQLIAADELCARGWWWHKKFRCWFIHAPNNPVVKNATARSERGTYLFFDTSIWDVVQVGSCAVTSAVLCLVATTATTVHGYVQGLVLPRPSSGYMRPSIMLLSALSCCMPVKDLLNGLC